MQVREVAERKQRRVPQILERKEVPEQICEV